MEGNEARLSSGGAVERVRRMRRPQLLLLPAILLFVFAFSPSVALALSGGISGKVTEVGSGHLPIEGIEVCAGTVNPSLEGEAKEGEGGCTKTGAGGEYTIANLNAGAFDVVFRLPSATTLNFIQQYYSGKSALSEATQVTVAEGAVTENIGAELEPGAELSGTLTRSGSGAALEGALVWGVRVIAPNKGQLVAETVTGAGGAYALAGVPAGNIDLLFLYFGSHEGKEEFGGGYYGGGQRLSEATPLAVAAKEMRAGLAFALKVEVFSSEEAPGGGAGPLGSSRTGTGPGSEGGSSPTGGSGGLGTGGSPGLSLASTRVAVAKDGRASIKVACSGSAACHGKLELRETRTVKHAGKLATETITIGRAAYTVKAGTKATVKIELVGSGRQELRAKRGRLPFHLSIVQATPAPSGLSVKDVVLVEAHKAAAKR